MSEFNTELPSIRQIQRYIKEKTEVEIKLLTNDLLVGAVAWQDPSCVCLRDSEDQTTMIWRQSIAYVKPKTD